MADSPDPFRAYNWKLVSNGITEAHFTECIGLGVEVEVIRYREAGSNQSVLALPGPPTYRDVTLRYGMTNSRELFDWMMTAVNGAVQRQNVSIVMLDTEGVTEVFRWNLTNAWPRKWEAHPLDALSRDVAIESLTLVFEGLERA